MMKNTFKKYDEILLNRVENLMPKLMQNTGIEMYIVVGDEYNEGPMVKSLLPSSFFHARKKAIFIFSMINGVYKKMIVSKPDFTISNFYEPVLLKPYNFDFEMFYSTFAKSYDIEKIRQMPFESEKECINKIVNTLKPKNIAIDYSNMTAFADGISKTNFDYILNCIGEQNHNKVVSGEKLALRWLETRTTEEVEIYKNIVKLTRDIIKKCYSKEVIKAGVTTIGDARFFLMEEAMRNYGKPWFDATVWIVRKGNSHIENDDQVILEGDILHCDFGFEICGLCSDVQEMAYVKRNNDEDFINQLNEIHNKAVIVQNCLAKSFVEGKTGNEILKIALEKSKKEGVEKPMIYTHPIGIYGHGPGPLIGSFTNQNFVKGMGEYHLNNNTFYAMELNVKEKVKDWDNQEIMYGQEIDVAFINNEVKYIGGRQKSIHII